MIFPRSFLQKGRNKFSAMYTNKYDLDRNGCISFFSEEKQFIYTDFPPYGANRVFPCFDQPDLKAKIKLTVVAQNTWTTLSNQQVIMKEPFDKEKHKETMSMKHLESELNIDEFLAKIT